MNATGAGRIRLIGVAGLSGSGKSTYAQALADAWPGALVLSADDYYRDLAHLSPQERAAVNFDHPQALDLDALAADLAALRQGLEVAVPVYDFASHTRRAGRRVLSPAPLVVVEGVLLLHAEAVRAALDLKVYVDAPMDLCLLRRLRRDLVERGRGVESVLAQYEASVRPMALAFVLPQRAVADLIVSGEDPVTPADAAALLALLPQPL
jgi:uridine kinase